VNWIKRVKAAFNKLKNVKVANKKARDFGVRIVGTLLEKLGIEKAKGPKRIPQWNFINVYRGGGNDDLAVEIRVPYYNKKDVVKMQRSLKVLERKAKQYTPVDTGRLKKSIRSDVRFERNKEIIVGILWYDTKEVVRVTKKGKRIYYAMAVHNNPLPAHNNPPTATWFFLGYAYRNGHVQRKVQELFE